VWLLSGFAVVSVLTVVLSGFFGIPGIRGKGKIMGDEKNTGQQPSDEHEKAAKEGEGTAGSIYSGSIYSGDPAPAQGGTGQGGTGDDPNAPASIYSGEPEGDEPDDGDDDGPPDDGSIYSG
jgi:hypothetical protein